ncbi:peptidylprolyl isomerase [Psychroflexus halocasei]|uniref:PPIC-type PPIASE domain-containing protein n=1 Tax=Psychroflexus halocasei TaxID=908615 RepID=A0A1H3WZW4_9FLAO|nr:peptidylprolyl isomerase [Psychroflexus halocasei]SDZ92520.1 PPIC-type PPIASE domain-containing protein [Psychroflexus halocasei]
MKKISLLILVIISINSLHAQRNLFKNSFDEYKDFGISKSEAKAYQKEGSLSVFNKEKHNTKLAIKLFNKKVGKSVKNKNHEGKIEYKVIAEAENKHYRINYIFFDGNKKSYEQIEEQREKMIKLLDSNYKFESLARQYSMDLNKYKGGDSGWFKFGSVMPDFGNAITNTMYYANEVFRVDIPERDWYYLVKKSHTPKNIKEILVLKTVE